MAILTLNSKKHCHWSGEQRALILTPLHLHSENTMKINSKVVLMAFFCCFNFDANAGKEVDTALPDGIMILIESTSEPTGLSTMVDQMKERNIPGLLMVTPEFVQANCDAVKDALGTGNIEVVASNVGAPFWGIPYEEQKSRIIQMMEGIESCTGEKPRIISSRYMASDMNTVKAAEDLGIPYVTARGTTGAKATVYQPEGYKTKILSVSNIPLVPFKYGSLCDFSFYERAGAPEDMRKELFRSTQPLTSKEKEWFGKHHKVTPVSHTYIGGHLKAWNDMWVDFWDAGDVRWVGLDEFMKQSDWEMPLWQIPINSNNPYTEEKVRPLTPYESEEKMLNPCATINSAAVINSNNPLQDSAAKAADRSADNKIVVFHNAKGPMCLDFMEFIEGVNYPVEQHLVGEEDFDRTFTEYKRKFHASEGLSPSFGYYPMIFINDRVFSGFDDAIRDEISKEVAKQAH